MFVNENKLMRCCFFQLHLSLRSVNLSFSFSRSKSDNEVFLFLLSCHFFVFRHFIRYIANFFFNVKLHRIGTLHFLCLSIGANQKALSLKGIRVKATRLSNAEINQSLKRYKKISQLVYAISLALFIPYRWLREI